SAKHTKPSLLGTQQKPRATPLTMYLRRCSHGVVMSFFKSAGNGRTGVGEVLVTRVPCGVRTTPGCRRRRHQGHHKERQPGVLFSDEVDAWHVRRRCREHVRERSGNDPGNAPGRRVEGGETASHRYG
ncbi:unnamed protein product, partial [Scytosiphon promiscuus]